MDYTRGVPRPGGPSWALPNLQKSAFRTPGRAPAIRAWLAPVYPSSSRGHLGNCSVPIGLMRAKREHLPPKVDCLPSRLGSTAREEAALLLIDREIHVSGCKQRRFHTLPLSAREQVPHDRVRLDRQSLFQIAIHRGS